MQQSVTIAVIIFLGTTLFVWFRIKLYQRVFVFIFLSHLFIWLLKITSNFLPTNVVALFPALFVGLLYGGLLLQIRSIHLKVHVSSLLVGGFIILGIAQIFNDNISPLFGLRGFYSTTFFAGIFFVGRHAFTSKKQATTLIKIIILTITIASVVAIIESVFGISLSGDYSSIVQERENIQAVQLNEERSIGTLIDQGAFGCMTSIGAICAFGWLVALQGKTWFSWIIKVIFFILIVAGLMLSGSRSSLIGFVSSVLVISLIILSSEIIHIFNAKQIKKMGLQLLALIPLAFAGLVIVGIFIGTSDTKTAQKTQERLKTISPESVWTGDVFRERNLVARVRMWQAILQDVQERPITGYGIGTLGGGKLQQEINHAPGGLDAGDNQYVALLGELGIFGLLFYVAIILITLAQSMRIERESLQKVF